MTDGNIKSFERVVRKYNIDFAVKKDKTTDPPKYVVFFKGRDADAVAQASAVLFCMPALGFAMNGNYAVSVHAEDTELERITFGVSVHGIEFDVIHVRNKYVSIQTCTEGYDYSVFDEDYRLIDGGVYDNPDISIHAALKDVLEDFGLSEQDKRIPVDYYGHFRTGCGD